MTFRLLLINPNTSANITALLMQEGEALLAPDTEITAVTAAEGVPYIASREDLARAGPAALAAFRDASACQDFDAVLLGCFGDPGLIAIRQAASCPVVTLVEASCTMAATLGGRFSVVTGGTAWIAILRELVDSLGYGPRVASIRAISTTGYDIAAVPEAALGSLADEIAASVAEGAEAVVIGGAGLAGLARRLASRSPVPLIDSVAAGVCQAQALARMRLRQQRHAAQ
jgi:allantoin racemase